MFHSSIVLFASWNINAVRGKIMQFSSTCSRWHWFPPIKVWYAYHHCFISIKWYNVFYFRYCNSHLQVLGFIPKKERKKKHDALDSVALNITVPSLALRASNGLDGLPPSPPCTRLPPLALSDMHLLDPFAFYEEDVDGVESTTRKNSILKRKPASRPVLSQQGPRHDADLPSPTSEQLTQVTVGCALPRSPHLPPLTPAAPAPPPPSQHAGHASYIQQGSSQALVCKPAPVPTGASLVPTTPPSAGQQYRKTFLTAPSHPSAGTRECPQSHTIAMRPTAFTAPPACLSRLQHLVQLCAQRHREHGDLFPHLGINGSLNTRL